MEPFHIGGEIHPGTDNAIFNGVAAKLAKGHRELTLTINSVGGCVSTSMAIYTLLRSLPIPVTTYIVGTCQSAAVIIFLAGSTRLITPAASIMTHGPGRKTDQHITLESAEQIIQSLKRDQEAMALVFADRLGINHDRALQYVTGEHWFNATEAAEAKFATEVAPFGNGAPVLFKATP